MAIAQTNYQPQQEGFLRRLVKRLRRKKEINDFIAESPLINARSRAAALQMRNQGTSDDEIIASMDENIKKAYAEWKRSRGKR